MNFIKKHPKKKYAKKDIPILIVALILSFYFSACVKYTPLTSPEEGTIYMPQAYSDRGDLSLYRIDSPQTVVFGIAYGGFNAASTDITADFEVDTSLITQYNIDNAYLGIHYVALPDSAYSIPSLSTVLKAGTTTSDPLSLNITATKLALGTHYLLPVKLVSISSGILDTSLTVTYFKIDTLTIRSRDITNIGTKFSYNYNDAPANNDTAESVMHLIDSNFTTKYYQPTYHTDMYVQLQFTSPTVINAYTLTSGNDHPERDPKDWNLSASDDGTNWTILDSRTNQIFANRQQTTEFVTSNTSTAYSYYRLNITANNDNNTSSFQCTEWRLLQFY